MKILLASGIFLPEAGGPATFAAKFGQELRVQGHEVAVLTFSDSAQHDTDKSFDFPIYRIKRSNKIMNYWRYFWKVKKLASGFDVVYALDHISAGFPAAMACQRLQKPFFVRVGGDFLWERYVENVGAITLGRYYEQALYKSDNFRFSMANYVFSIAKKIIFTTQWQKNIFEKYYQIDKQKIELVKNAQPLLLGQKHAPENKEIIFAGRLNSKNNISNLLSAWKKIDNADFKLVIIGSGPQQNNIAEDIKNVSNAELISNMNQEQLHLRMSECYLMIFPSLSDISPNLMLEAISLGVPFISTDQLGFEWVKSVARLFDPQDADQMAEAIRETFDESVYQKYSDKLRELKYDYQYSQAVEDTISIFKK